MRALLTALCLLALSAGCGPLGGSDGEASPASVDLEMTVRPKGDSGPSRKWTLRCDPPGGSLPNAARACTRLSNQRDPFRPLPRDAICTQIYGGPAEATIRGRFRGKRIAGAFKRTNGCEIARWNRVSFLFPSGSG